MGGHRNHPPHPSPALLNLPDQLGLSLRIPFVLSSDLLKRRPNQLPIHRMTPHTGIAISNTLPTRRISSKRIGTCDRPDHQNNTKGKTPNPHPHGDVAFGFPGCTEFELLTGAGLC